MEERMESRMKMEENGGVRKRKARVERCGGCWVTLTKQSIAMKTPEGQPFCEECVQNSATDSTDFFTPETNKSLIIADEPSLYFNRRGLERSTVMLTQQTATSKVLASYAPSETQLYSLAFDTTYFDIIGRAPRWANHSGNDYH
ncbi:hypothetical protein HK096_003590, partial [Nowakowskiella sp. JEL0078]